MSTKKEKLTELLQVYQDYDVVDKYVLVKDGRYYLAAIVSIDGGKDYKGFHLTEIPKPDTSDTDKTEWIVEKYGDVAVYDKFMAKLVIENQQSSRALITGTTPTFDMAKAWKQFAGSELTELCKTGDKDNILDYLKTKWSDHFASIETNEPQMFL